MGNIRDKPQNIIDSHDILIIRTIRMYEEDGDIPCMKDLVKHTGLSFGTIKRRTDALQELDIIGKDFSWIADEFGEPTKKRTKEKRLWLEQTKIDLADF